MECVCCAIQVYAFSIIQFSFLLYSFNTEAFPLVFLADYAAEDRQQSVRKGVQRHRSRKTGEKVSIAT
jgi:hypothetical protein